MARHTEWREAKKVEDRSALRPPVIYEIARRRGDEEMDRPATSLWRYAVMDWRLHFRRR